MNLQSSLLAEHSKANTMRIVKWIGNDKKRFAELVNVFLHSEYRVTQRAAWPLSYSVREHPELVQPHFGRLIDNLFKPGLHPSVPRNTLRFLEEVEVPEKYLGKLLDACFKFMKSSEAPIAVKAFAMTVAMNIVKKEPELKRELKLVVEDLLVECSPAIRVRGKRVLAAIEKMK